MNTTQQTVLVTGGTGFIGRAVRRELNRRGVSTRLLVRRPTFLRERETQHIGDIRSPDSVAAAVRGVETILHCASYVGRDPEVAEEVNARGTRNLATAAASHGVRKVIATSTTSVYGCGPHRALAESNVLLSPESRTTQTRIAGERAVRDIGGSVLRLTPTYGPADRWLVPGIIRVTSMLSGVLEGGAANLSLLDVDDGARFMVDVAALSDLPPVLHVGPTRPTSLMDLLSECQSSLGIEIPRSSVGFEVAADRLRAYGLSRHQLSLAGQDNWFDVTLASRYAVLPEDRVEFNLGTVAYYRGILATYTDVSMRPG